MGLWHGLKQRLGADQLTGRVINVGWLLEAESASLIYGDPVRVKSEPCFQKHSKSAARCPAIIDMESRYFMVTCPIDIHLRLVNDKAGNYALRNMGKVEGSIRQNHLSKMIHIVPAAEWRHPNRPMIQIDAPYRFISDDTVFMSQCGPFLHYNKRSFPGLVFGGRFPIHIWPRALMWAFEWHDTSQDLIIRRGDPWFYVHFESEDPTFPVRLVRAEMTRQLEDYVKGLAGVTNYVNKTFSLFPVARSRRPKKLLKVLDINQSALDK